MKLEIWMASSAWLKFNVTALISAFYRTADGLPQLLSSWNYQQRALCFCVWHIRTTMWLQLETIVIRVQLLWFQAGETRVCSLSAVSPNYQHPLSFNFKSMRVITFSWNFTNLVCFNTNNLLKIKVMVIEWDSIWMEFAHLCGSRGATIVLILVNIDSVKDKHYL